MPRMPRVNVEGALYYITSRGDRNQEIFKDKEDYATYIELLKKYKKHHGFKLFSYILLPSHLHLLIELSANLTISQIMHDLNSSYIKYFNKKYERTGHLFTERYRCVLIEKDPWLKAVTAHMHLNPVRVNAAESWKEYSLGSAKAYLGAKDTELDLTEEIKEVNTQLKGVKYEDFLASLNKEEIKTLKTSFARKLIVGSREFKNKIEEKVEETKTQEPEEQSDQENKFIFSGSVAVVVLLIIVGFLIKGHFDLKEKYNLTTHRKKIEMERRIREEKELVTKNLKEKYAADEVSFEAMQKRLEIEKKKIKELEKKIN
ncbi:MAG: transposase [Candidatus Omnitrophota bacterium]